MSATALAIFADGSALAVDESFAPPRGRRDAVLAVPSEWCLCAGISPDGLPAKGRRQAMLYRLEEKLPLAAEDVSADFIVGADFALGVCAPTATLLEAVRGVQAKRAEVLALCPIALLALQHRVVDAGPDVVAWAQDGRVELFILRGGIVTDWSVLPEDAKDVLLHLRLKLAEAPRPLKMLALGVPDELVEAVRKTADFDVEPAPPESMAPHASAQGAKVLAGAARPWADLGRNGLASRDPLRPVRIPLAFAAAAMALLLICTAAAMLWRSLQYDRLAATYADRQQAAYRKAFPNQSPPADVRSRLAAEERRLRALAGEASPTSDASGLLVLRDVLAHLPADDHLRVHEIHLEGSHFTLEGQTASHGSADAIAAALRRRPGFAVEPARTEQLAETAGADSGSIGFTIQGDAASRKEAR